MLVATNAAPGLRARLRMFDQRFAESGAEGNDAGGGDEDEPAADTGMLPEWTVVDRVIASRRTRDGGADHLVKWKELGYDECTWESEADLKGFEEEVERFRTRAAIASARSRPSSFSRAAHHAAAALCSARSRGTFSPRL